MFRQILITSLFALFFLTNGFLLGQYFDMPRDTWVFFREKLAVIIPQQNAITAGTDESLTLELDLNGQKESELFFPPLVGQFSMEKLISGNQALELSNSIHGEEMPIHRVYIVHYRFREEQAILWVFDLESERDAEVLLGKINDRFEEGRDRKKVSSFYLKDDKICHVNMFDMDNYYFKKNSAIFWISLVAPDPVPRFLAFYEIF